MLHAQGLENLAEHLASAYTGKSYVELMQECPKAVEKLYHRYFAVVCPQKNLSFGTAIRAWDALSIGTVFKSYGEWKEFLLKEQKLKGSISKVHSHPILPFPRCLISGHVCRVVSRRNRTDGKCCGPLPNAKIA
jgi:hypothetical protein